MLPSPIARLTLLVAALSFGGCAPKVPGAVAPSTGAARASDFTLRALDGSTVHLSDYLGKDVVMISFWATWCTPCLGEVPHLVKLHQKYKGQGFTLLSIAMDGPETMANVEPTARRYGIDYPVLLDEDTRVLSVYNPARDAPFTVIIGKDGRIAETRVGFAHGEETVLEERLRGLLGLAAAGTAK
ncbi:MAG: peroxiredoxin family protein [Myxococcaceae bacterium]